MKSKEWSVWKAGLLGAVVGAAISVAMVMSKVPHNENQFIPETPAEWGAYMIGGAAAVMLFFALVAVLRNFLARRYR